MGRGALLAIFLPLLGWSAPALTLIPEATEITSADRVWVEIAATAAPDSEIQLPFVGAELGGFVVRDRSEQPPRLDASGEELRASLRCLLEPALPGAYEIPPLTAILGGSEVATQPVRITVTSVLPEVTHGLAPKEALGKLSHRPWWAYALVVVLGLLSGAVLSLKKTRVADGYGLTPGEAFAREIRLGELGNLGNLGDMTEVGALRGRIGALLSERTGLPLHTVTASEIDAISGLPAAARQPLRAVLETLDRQQFGDGAEGSSRGLVEALKRLEAAL